MKIQSGISDF